MNEPQLSAEMEAKLKAWSEQDNGGDFVTEGYGYYEELKHFLATALEEQRRSFVKQVEEYFGHIENDGVTGKPLVVTREDIIKDILAILNGKAQ